MIFSLKKVVLLSILTLVTLSSNAQLYLNEVVPSNDAVLADNYGEYDDIIEIYNAGNTAVNVAGYYLSDDAANPTQWQIPSTDATLTTVTAGGYLIFWADDETAQGANHLNFKLSSNGESVILTNPDGVTVEDSFTFPAVVTDYGYGRLPDGSGNFSNLTPASPASSNNASQPKLELPVITPPDGIYTSLQTISITAEAGASIHYTTDGTTPTTSSPLYTGTFPVDTSQNIRAIAVKSGFADSDISTNSLIINPSTQLSILHLTIDPKYLWDDQIGMYTVGTNGIIGPCSTNPRNYFQDWEYPGNVTLYEKDGSVAFSEDCGLSISGGCSRRFSKKSFNVSFKKEYGISKLENYQLFDTQEETTWDGFKVRSGGNRYITHRALDATAQKVVENQLDIDHQSSRPVALYLNGQYWGMYHIRDRMNANYVQTHHPKIDSDNLDLIKFPVANAERRYWIYEQVAEGDNIAYHQLHNFIENNDLSNTTAYEYVSSQVDINSFLDYFITNIYYNNLDWPGNNLKVWRERINNSKWRWMWFDCESMFNDNGVVNTTLLDSVMYSTSYVTQRNPIACVPFRGLMENPDFEADFIQRTNTYLHTVWNSTRVADIYTKITTEIESEIQADFDRWGGWDLATWTSNFYDVYDYFVERPQYVRAMIDKALNVSGRFDLTLNFDATSNGTVAIHGNYFEVPYNYTGTYHPNIPIELHAIPAPGYRFSHWQETGNTNATLYQSFNSNTILTPIFEPALDIVINEIHYNPNDTLNEKEFIEIYNPDTKARDLSTYEFTEGVCFKFPKGTNIAVGEYLIVAADATQYLGNGYQVFQWNDSKLNNDGEELVLKNAIGATIDSIRYNDGIPWALLSDGFGASLELNYPMPTANIDAADWHASAPDGGTPGAQNSMPCATSSDEIIINEINYNSDNTTNPSDWVELHNPNSTSIDISNWQFYDSGNAFTIPNGTVLAADEYLVLTEDATAFGSIFPHLNNGTDYLGDFTFSLSNGGERVSLFDQNKCLVDQLKYDDEMLWDTIPDGNGPTLSLITPNSDNTQAQSWEASSNINSAYGTPGRINAPCWEQEIIIPDTIYTYQDTLLTVDFPNDDVTYNWFVIGGTSTDNNADSTLVNFTNPGTYNIQLITNYFECTNVSFKQVVVVPGCVDIDLHAWLEGPYDPTLGEMATTLSSDRKLLPGQTPVSAFATPTPAGQPYATAPWNYTGTEGAGWTDADYTGNETDWVLVSFRTGTAKNTEVGMTAGLLMKDGSITFPDRCALLSTVASPLYIVLEHRNHIGIMTKNPIQILGNTLSYDFRLADSFNNSTGFGQKQLPTGEWVMYAGDADQSDFPSYDITGSDKNIWTQNNGIFDYYFSPDFNLDGDINGQDKNIWERNNGISSRVPK